MLTFPGAPKFISGFCGIGFAESIVFCVMFCGGLFAFFLSTFEFSVLLQFSVSDCPFSKFNLLLHTRIYHKETTFLSLSSIFLSWLGTLLFPYHIAFTFLSLFVLHLFVCDTVLDYNDLNLMNQAYHFHKLLKTFT
jgi:hypothetical protein